MSKINELDELLISSIIDDLSQFEIALPEIVSDTAVTYKFTVSGMNMFHPDLSLQLYREGLGNRLDGLTIEDVKKHNIAAIDVTNGSPKNKWSIYTSFVGSILIGSDRYAINEGVWYKISSALKDKAEEMFQDLKCDSDPNLTMLIKKGEAGKKNGKTYYEAEKDYNRRMADESSYLLLDDRLIKLDTLPGRGFEACDLLDIENRRMIHVKKNSRRSSVLTHFFKQGANSAQLFKKYDAFKDGMVAKVRHYYGDDVAEELISALDDRWTVEYRIADFPRDDGSHNIPFFSKLTLQDEAENLGAMDFDIKIGFISLPKI